MAADKNGRPFGKAVFRGIRVVLEAEKDLNLEEWATARNQKKQLELHLIPTVLGGKTHIIHFIDFIDAHLVELVTNFTSRGETSMTETLYITCAGVRDGTTGTEYSAYWRRTYFDNIPANTINYNQIKIKEPTITNINWIDSETKETLKQTTYTENIALTAQIENQEGDTAKITIKKEDGTEFKTGQTELTFEEVIDEQGKVELTTIEIKEQWQDFKTADIDKLIATITHSGTTKKSKPLEIVPPPKVIVDFRPAENYDGEYGFDYMRHEKEKDDKLTYKDILGTNKKVNDADTFSLKDDHYKTITFPWYKDSAGKEIEYLQSWLTIYPEKKLKLSLQLETIENPKELELSFKYDKTLFKLSTETIPAQSKGKKRLKDHLEIECLKEFDTEDQTIKVMYKKRQLGQLNILKNSKANQYKAQVVFVKVTTNLKGAGKGKDGITVGEEAYLKKQLKQALVNLDLVEDKLDLTEKDANGDLLYPDFNTDYTLLNKDKLKILNKHNNTVSADNLVIFMEKEYNKVHPEHKNHYKIFFFGDRGGRKIYEEIKVNGRTTKKDTGKIKGLGGYNSKAIDSRAVVVFSGKTKATVTHETLHAIALKHTFSSSATFTYKKGATLNIMDYSHLEAYGNKKRILTWLWQWKKLWSKLPKE